jgi:hypothetical protein
MKKHAMLVLAWLSIAALGVLVITVALQAEAPVAGEGFEGDATAGQEAPAAALGTIVSVASYNGLPAAGSGLLFVPSGLLFVPHVGAGDLNSTLFIQNPAENPADVLVSFYAADGSNAGTEMLQIPASGSHRLEATALPAGFEGSAVIEATEPVQAVVNLQAATADSLLSYTAMPAGDMEAVLLPIMRNFYGWDTSFSIQNTGIDTADVTMSYFSAAGLVYNSVDSIPAGASHVYRQADMPGLGVNFSGYVLVQSTAPIAAVVERWSSVTAFASACNGISPASTGSAFFFPRQQKAVDGWTSAVPFVNLGSVVADLMAHWHSGSGSLVWNASSTVPPGQVAGYALAAIPEIPSGFDGSLVVEATEPLAAVADSQNQGATGDGLATVTGQSQLATTAYLPRVAHVESAGLRTELSIQNGSGTGATEVTITFYDESGTATATVSDSIPPYGVARYDTAGVPALGADWEGSAIVNATELIAVEAMQVIEYTPPPCDYPLSGVSLDGPTSGYTETVYAFTASISPPNATQPISYTWIPAPESGQATSTASYEWAQPGVYSLTVTAENCGGPVSDTHVILVGSVVTTSVDPESGGTLVYTNTQGMTTTVQVPPDAVDQATTLVYLPLQPESPPSGFAFAGQGFDLEAFQNGTLVPGLVFAQPVTVTIHYSDADVAGLDEESLTLTYWTDSMWQDAACGPAERHLAENWLAVPICHLSQFGLLGEKRAFAIYLPLVQRNYGACSTIPVLLSPANGSNPSTIAPLFRWDGGSNPNATSLRMEVAKDPGFTQHMWGYSSSLATGEDEFRFPWNLAPATTYYWRAWLECGEMIGPYSEVWSFTTGADGTILPAPVLVAPANGSVLPNRTVAFQWSSVSGAVEYLVRWREAGEGGFYLDWATDTQLVRGLGSSTTYEWWVSARNEYAIGTDSQIWQFTTPAGLLSSPGGHENLLLEDGTTHQILETGQ